MLTIFSLVVFVILLPAWLTHRSMASMAYRKSINIKKWAKFSEFEKEFYKVQWKRDIFNRYSFTTIEKSNYIVASIVIVNDTQFIFGPIAYLRFSWFLFKNRTTEKNKDIIVNSPQDLRARKLRKLKTI